MPKDADNRPYVMPITIEDFPNQDITLTNEDGTKESRAPDTPLSSVPLQVLENCFYCIIYLLVIWLCVADMNQNSLGSHLSRPECQYHH